MIWDAAMAGALAKELREFLVGARARSFVFERDRRRVLVFFREETLVVDLGTGRGLIYLDETADPPPSATPLPAHLRTCHAVTDERIVILGFKRVRGKAEHPSLVINLATNRWNALLVDGPDHRVRARLDASRPNVPRIGKPWSPTSSAREGRDGALALERWVELVDPVADAPTALVGKLAYSSPLNLPYLCDPDVELEVGLARWSNLAMATELSPVVFTTPRGTQAYPFRLHQEGATSHPRFLDAMASLGADGPSVNTVAEVAAYFDRGRKRLEKKKARLQDQLGKAGKAAELRTNATLILSSLHQIPKGATTVVLAGFDGMDRTLTLAPPHPPQRVAEKLFARATRLERATRELPKQITLVDQQLHALVDQRERIEAGTLDPMDVLPTQTPQEKRGEQGPSLPYRKVISSGGIEIRIGKGSAKNDELTFKYSRPGDVWLHARYVPGAHVVLRWDRKDAPPPRDLEEAAILAASFSKARHSDHVPVDWTRRRFVRKPRNARAGSVLPDRVKTLFVTPDEDLVNRLSDGSGEPI